MNDIKNCHISNTLDWDGNPDDGHVIGVGLKIIWQRGPVEDGPEQKAPNGAFLETIISACIQRLRFFQESKFACEENELAIIKLEEALSCLEQRTRERESRGVEGTQNK